MGDRVHIFSFIVSAANFFILAFMFDKIVVQPMVEAVQVRGQKVASRLTEIGLILTEARATEATYQAQFSRLAAEEEELRAVTEREIERVTGRIKSAGEAEAAHVVAKAGRESEKTRVEALAKVQRQIVAQAIARVETAFRQNLDGEGHSDPGESSGARAHPVSMPHGQ